MKIDLTPYRKKTVCVAVSGGKDSMALLHYFLKNGSEYGIFLCALNCDHAIRGAESERDSRFVRDYCTEQGIPLVCYRHDGEALKSEAEARRWRYKCFSDGAQSRRLPDGKLWHGYDFLAVAHHADDNAETVLFNLIRGSSLSGVCGMERSKTMLSKREFPDREDYTEGEAREPFALIRPLLDCTRGEIDEYIRENALPYVTDSSNLTDDYTRNKLRHNVIPALENCVPGAVRAIGRFSALAREDEDFFYRATTGILKRKGDGYLISPCAEGVIFKRAAVRVLVEEHIENYTSVQLNSLFSLQSADVGKRFEFLGMVGIKEGDGVFLFRRDSQQNAWEQAPFADFLRGREEYCGRVFCLSPHEERAETFKGIKPLRLDVSKIPFDAVVRFMQAGDIFRKFGSGTKKLGDFFTDKKIPVRLRGAIPLIAKGNEIYAVGGVEISEQVKITVETESENRMFLFCADPFSTE